MNKDEKTSVKITKRGLLVAEAMKERRERFVDEEGYPLEIPWYLDMLDSEHEAEAERAAGRKERLEAKLAEA